MYSADDLLDRFCFCSGKRKEEVCEYATFGNEILKVRDTDGRLWYYDSFGDDVRCFSNAAKDEDSMWLGVYGYLLRRQMWTCGLDLTGLSEMSGISKSALSTYCRGEKMPTAINYMKLCDALKLPLDYFHYIL